MYLLMVASIFEMAVQTTLILALISPLRLANNFFLKLCRMLFAWFSYFVRSVRLFWGMFVRGGARRDLC